MAQHRGDLARILAALHDDIKPHLGKGEVASYIPALASIDPRRFGIAIHTCDGRQAKSGDADTPFSVQSISKVFTLSLALQMVGANLWRRVGKEPSGSRFNSILELEHGRGIPRNPLINAGGLVVTDTVLGGGDSEKAIFDIVEFMRKTADDASVAIDSEVARSEAFTGFRNASMANFLRGLDNLNSPVADVLEVYYNQCALSMSCSQLARSGLFLANRGTDPISGVKFTSPVRARRINALMMTCGQYDGSGEFAFRVGLPSKSGVGGGILAIVPGHAAIAVWSPGLTPEGNSLVGTIALERLVAMTGWTVF